ncbi:transcriptional activator domain-containing protein [Actinobacteria bacterium OK074]|nr:transcriptional activator domain-containing protein [Actinobacteria bacterium OK074]
MGEALALWRGPALADLPDRTAATRAEALRREAARARVEAELRLGHATDVVPELRHLTAADPYDEPLHALLIRALRDTGRVAEALASYETVRRGLREALGTDPGVELRSLHEGLLAGERGGLLTGQHEGVSAGDRGGLLGGRHEELLAGDHEGLVVGDRGGLPAGDRESSVVSDTGASAPLEGRGELREQPRRTRTRQQAGSPEPLGGPSSRKGNLRPRLNSFVGREPDLVAIRSDLQQGRLVTLTGPGGSGKTRLAEQAAAGTPAWLVELAPLDRPEAVPGAVVSALGLRETVLITNELAVPQSDPVELLVEHCAPRSELLILDNCEHVIDAAARLAETLLTRCPGLTILATSREPLGVPGESVRPVEPLPPDPAQRLFRERAAAVRPDADAVLADKQAVDEICRRLDGLPLAIELAAARLRLLTPRQIADRLDDRFRLLTSGSRTALPRQQTLRAVVDWSWDLLDERERTVLCEVSVFAGGWDLAAAEAVCGAAGADLIGALVDKSLVVATPDGPDGTTGMRYRLLETIHEYAEHRAAETPGLGTAAARRHRAWVRALVEEAEPRLRSADQLPWIRRLETELDNIRAALDNAITTADEDTAVAICLAAGWFWWLRNHRPEGMSWTERVLRLGAGLDTATTRGDAAGEPFRGAGNRASGHEQTRTRQPSQATPPLGRPTPDHVDAFVAAPDTQPTRMRLRLLNLFLFAESRPVAEAMGDSRMRPYITAVRDHFAGGGPEAAFFPGIVWPFTDYYLGMREDGRSYTDLKPFLDRTVANCRAYGGDWEVGVTLMFRTHAVVDAPGRLAGVDADLAELRALSRRVGDRWMRAQVCSAAGEADMARGRYTQARQEYEEALRLAHEVGANAETPFLHARLAEIAYRAGDRAGALITLDRASEAADAYGVTDSRAFVRLLRAQLALDDGQPAQARVWWAAARQEMGRGTPPPQFLAMLNGVDALVTLAESGPRPALTKTATALHEAVTLRCAETVTASLAHIAVDALARLGDHARVVRLIAAADSWTGNGPDPVRLSPTTEQAEATARTALDPHHYAVEHAKGASLTVDDVLREIAEAVDLTEG